ncbi:MAG: tryptophan 7-halogenase [Chloroflexi bacterium]|nr:tryptophan 7-halogenase [Chloroflexota bacterium]
MVDGPVASLVVIGGGSGGSTAATLLARQGFDVTLFERQGFPGQHVGESLLPASIPILETLDVIEEIEAAGFTPKHGVKMDWGHAPEPWSWHIAETNAGNPHTDQVWRPNFDQMLLCNVAANSVDVHEGSCIVDVAFESGQPTTVTLEYLSGNAEI